jgi:hypothetical protein
MGWFTALLVRGEYVEGEAGPPRRGDVIYKLVEAPDAEGAYRRALEMGASMAESFTDDGDGDGRSYTFRFMGLADLVPLPAPPGDGAEVFSRFVPSPPEPMLLAKDELAAFPKMESEADEDDAWADGEGPVDTDEDEEAAPEADADAEPFAGGTAPLKPR